MKYLAFDIEAANGFKLYSICSVGFVFADENFEIEKQFNLWINPKTAYNLNGTRANIELNLNLDKEVLNASPDFKQRYQEIKSLLTAPDTVVIGHAVESDVRMLNAALKHYHLPAINFEFVCSQLLYKCFREEKEVKSLTKIANELNLEFLPHTADDDARISFLTLSYLCTQTGLSIDGLLEKYRVRKGKTENFEITRTVNIDGQNKKKITHAAVEKIVRQIGQIKKENKKKSLPKNDRIVALSRNLELYDGDVLNNVLRKLVLEGGQYTSKVGKCNVYIYCPDPDIDDMREKHLDMLIENGKMIEKISVNEYLKIPS